MEERGTVEARVIGLNIGGDRHELIKAQESSEGSKSLDPWKGYQYGSQTDGLKLIEPPYDPLAMAKLSEASDILGACINAMITNVDGFGYQLKRIDDPDNETELPAEAEKERDELINFFKYINTEDNITSLRSKVRADYEQVGYAFIEVVRSVDNTIVELYHLEAHTVRLTELEEDPYEFDQKIRDASGNITTVRRRRRFRKFVQRLSTDNKKKVVFKEFGDPRKYNSKTGKESANGDANEIIYLRQYASYTPYGIPRWIGGLIKILGSRKADEVNYLFFDNKSIPPLVVTVSGGALTNDAVDAIKQMFEKELKGSTTNFHKALILEAVPHTSGDLINEKVSPVKINVQPLTEFIQDDALFQTYMEKNRNNIRSTFRLPPIYTGDSQDYTRATAFESARVAEEQSFRPERQLFDYKMNRLVLTDMDINYWEFESLGVKTSDLTDVVTAMGLVKEALPVAVIQETVADMRGVPRGKIPTELYTQTLAEHQANSAPQPVPQEDSPDDTSKDDNQNEPTDKENE